MSPFCTKLPATPPTRTQLSILAHNPRDHSISKLTQTDITSRTNSYFEISYLIGLDLGTYEGIQRGARGKDGLTRSVLSSTPENPGVPLLVQHLLARRNEVAGEAPQATLGMPLGMPPLPDEEIGLVWAWINQGAPH